MNNYFITAMTSGPIDRNWNSQTFGYYPTLEEAISAVERNVGGMDECMYDWIVIESVPPGVYGSVSREHNKDNIWFKWVHPENEHGRWERCERPEEFKNICSFF